MPGAGGTVEEALAIIVEVPRGARPADEDMQALASHVRATVLRPPPLPLCQRHMGAWHKAACWNVQSRLHLAHVSVSFC